MHPWFAMESASSDRAKGWATFARLSDGGGSTYVFRPRGLNAGGTYRVTSDSANTAVSVGALRLMQEGLPIRLESALSSELLLFEKEPA